MGPEVHNLSSQGFPLIARGTRLEVRKPFFATVFFFFLYKKAKCFHIYKTCNRREGNRLGGGFVKQAQSVVPILNQGLLKLIECFLALSIIKMELNK